MEPVDSMAGLIMGFSKLKKQKAPELPPRDDAFSMISEDVESDEEKVQSRHDNYANKAYKKELSIDTDTILKQVHDNLETSQGSIQTLVPN